MSNPSIFPFLSLPRELRDAIYSHSLKDLISIELSSELRFHISNYPYPHLLHINHQITKELQETAQELSSLNVYNASIFNDPSPRILAGLPPPVKRVRNVTFDVNVWAVEDVAAGLGKQYEWICGVVEELKRGENQEGKEKVLDFHLYLISNASVEQCEAAILWTGIFTKREDLGSMWILRNKGEERVLLSRWDSGKRQFARVAEDWMQDEGENVSLSCGPSGLMWQGEVAYLFE